MAKMTPEQEAAYALRWGVARSGLPPDAQLAYDRLVEQQARAAASAPPSPASAEAASSPVILPGGCRPGDHIGLPHRAGDRSGAVAVAFATGNQAPRRGRSRCADRSGPDRRRRFVDDLGVRAVCSPRASGSRCRPSRPPGS